MDRLERIHVKGFKSIRELDLKLGPINVLIGGNGAGKSNFVSLFGLLRAKMAGELDNYVRRCGGASSLLYYGAKRTPAMEFTLELQAGQARGPAYHLLLSWAATDVLTTAQHDQVVQVSERSGHLEPVLEQCRVFQFHDTSLSSRVRTTAYIKNNRHLMSDGGNLAAFLYMLRETKPEYYRRIVATIRGVAPHFGDFELEPDKLNPDSILLNWREAGEEYLFGPHQLPDGLLRFMALATLLLQPDDTLPGIVVIDEPELGLHPYAINVLGGLVRKAATRCQLILATQSANLVDQFGAEEIITVERREGASVFQRLRPDELEEWLDEYTISELWEKNVIGGRPAR